MSDATLFRAAEPEPTQPEIAAPTARGEQVTETSFAPTEMPPSLFQEAHKPPLALDILDAIPAYRTTKEMEMNSNLLDTYLNEEVKRQGLPDTRESYESVLTEALKTLHLEDAGDSYGKVEKLRRYFSIQHGLTSLVKEKEQLMQKDITEMTAAQLKRHLKLNHNIATV